MKKTLLVLIGALVGSAAIAGELATVDFSITAGKVNPGLQSSSWAPRLSRYPRGVDDEALVTNLHVRAFRTHDAQYANYGLYLGDVQSIFPLMHLDANDPKNYVFGPTDAWLSMGVRAGLDVFYRLGSSIEHTGKWGYGTLNPKDHAKYAEVCAGIVRHYNQGWADGKRWNIKYWELFNEPDWKNCWRGTKAEFIDLFITCFKRLKREFPEIKVGGPAMSWCNVDYFRDLLDACRKAGVKPDFVSWHHYGDNLAAIQSEPARMRALCAEYGIPDVELIVSEWHYIHNWAMFDGKNPPEKIAPGLTGVASHNGIDSAVYTLSSLARFHATPLGQSYFYGMGYANDFGMADRRFVLNKVYHGVRLHGEITSGYTDLVSADYNRTNANYTVLGAWNQDRSKACLLVADYRGGGKRLEVAVKGLDGFAAVGAELLDATRDGEPTSVDYRNGRLVIDKRDTDSAAYLVFFSRPVLRFGLMTDTHVGEAPASCARLRQALTLFREKGVPLIVNAGDVADQHISAAYHAYRRTFDEVFPTERPREIFAYATHDAFAPDYSMPDIPGFFEAMRRELKATNAHTDEVTFQGCTFLVFPQYTGGGGFLSWTDYERKVAEACRRNPGKPVFIVDHVPPAGTVYHSWEWGERHTREILDRYPQAVHLSGHVHGSLRNDAFFWRGAFTAINAGCLQQWSGLTVGEPPARKPSYGVLTVDVFEDWLVVRRWDVRDGSEIEPERPWIVPFSFRPGNASFSWKRPLKKEFAPQFDAAAKLSVAAEGAPFAGYRLAFPGQVEGAAAVRIEAQRKGEDGAWCPAARIERIADYWKRPAERAKTDGWFFPAAYFEPSTTYRLRVSPVGQFGAVGRALVSEVTTPAAFAPTKVVYASKDPMKELAFCDKSGKRMTAEPDGFYVTGDRKVPCCTGPAGEWTWGLPQRNRLHLPKGVFAGPVGTRYRVTLDAITWQADEGSTFRLALQQAGNNGVEGVTARVRTPNGYSDPSRYVLEFAKDAAKASDSYDLMVDMGGGRIRFESIRVEILPSSIPTSD